MARRRLWLAIALIGLPVVALALGERPGRHGWRPPRAGAPAVIVYLTYNAFHSDLVVPESALQAYQIEGPTIAATRRLRPSTWMAFGWGDMRFYRNEGVGLSRGLDAVRAAVSPGNLATVHLQRTIDPREQKGDWNTVQLRLLPSDFQAMVSRMDAAFALKDGRPEAAADAVSLQEVYFNGRGAFSIFDDCNHWIGDLIGAAGAPHNRVLDTTSWGLSLDTRLRAGATELRRPTS